MVIGVEGMATIGWCRCDTLCAHGGITAMELVQQRQYSLFPPPASRGCRRASSGWHYVVPPDQYRDRQPVQWRDPSSFRCQVTDRTLGVPLFNCRGWLYVWVGHQNDIAVFQLLNEAGKRLTPLRIKRRIRWCGRTSLHRRQPFRCQRRVKLRPDKGCFNCSNVTFIPGFLVLIAFGLKFQ